MKADKWGGDEQTEKDPFCLLCWTEFFNSFSLFRQITCQYKNPFSLSQSSYLYAHNEVTLSRNCGFNQNKIKYQLAYNKTPRFYKWLIHNISFISDVVKSTFTVKWVKNIPDWNRTHTDVFQLYNYIEQQKEIVSKQCKT